MFDVFRADTPDLDDAAWTQFRMSLRDCYTADAHDLAIINIAGCAFERGQMTHYECWKIIHDFYMQTHATMNQEEIDVIS